MPELPDIDPKQFAEWCVATHLIRENSYDGEQGRYTMGWEESAEFAGVPQPWAKIIAVLCFPGYCDVWEWCEEQGVKLD